MSIKIGQLLEELFKKVAQDTTSEELKPLFAIDTEVADEFANKLSKGLLTLEAAKGNPDINRIFRQSHFGTIDKKLEEIMKNSGLTPDEEYEKEPNTLTKLEMISKSLIEAGKKKAEVNNKGEAHEQLKKQAEDFAAKEAQLQRQLKESTDQLTNSKKEFESTRDADLTDYEVSKLLLGKDYIFPKEMDTNVKVNTAYGTLKQELAKGGLKLRRNEAGQLEIVDKEGNPAYDDKHSIISDTNSWMDGVLAKNKLLKINDDSPQGGSSNGANGGIIIPNGKGQKNSAVINELAAQAASLPG